VRGGFGKLNDNDHGYKQHIYNNNTVKKRKKKNVLTHVNLICLWVAARLWNEMGGMSLSRSKATVYATIKGETVKFPI
jgi:hypothetical protein